MKLKWERLTQTLGGSRLVGFTPALQPRVPRSIMLAVLLMLYKIRKDEVPMKHLVMLAILILASRVCADQKPVAEFTVTGYGKVFYTVDMADMQFSVSVRDKNVQECKRMHDAVVDKLNEYLKVHKYPQEMLSLEDTILKRERANRDSYTYLAQSTYSMRTNRIKELSSLQADIVEIGVDEIHFVKLFSSKQRILEDQARKHAIEDAKSKASLTAKQLGWTLDKPTGVIYTTTRYSSGGFGTRSGSSAASSGATSANFVDITVQISFSYKNEDETTLTEDKPDNN